MSRAELDRRGEQGTKPAEPPRHSIALKTHDETFGAYFDAR
jgi:hypothetical protein